MSGTVARNGTFTNLVSRTTAGTTTAARLLASRGAKVVVNDLGCSTFGEGSSREWAESTVAEIAAAGGEAVVVQADVAKKADAERLIAETIAAFGRVDILVSNAGIIIDRPFVDSTDEDWTRAIESNLHGFFNVTRAVLPHMIGRRQGRIIATGSCITEVADFGGNCYSVCAASKGGIIAMLRPMAAARKVTSTPRPWPSRSTTVEALMSRAHSG